MSFAIKQSHQIIIGKRRMKPTDRKIYLASKSARRRELLRQIGIEFELLMTLEEVDESVNPGEKPHDYVTRVTKAKLTNAVNTMRARQLKVRPIVAADTTVVIDNLILGKPASFAQAVDMIRRLSGQTHHVYTSVAVAFHDDIWQLTQCSEVTFETIPEEVIIKYCKTKEPFDKAGAYGIQGVAATFIKEIKGSYSGIMGLPLFETAQLLQNARIPLIG